MEDCRGECRRLEPATYGFRVRVVTVVSSESDDFAASHPGHQFWRSETVTYGFIPPQRAAAQMSSPSLDRGSKLRAPSLIAIVLPQCLMQFKIKSIEKM
ncbi:hypothetical protein TNCV_3561881 [Trichonephila clavipes]|nr:hypothetical protein TNCV_3561881 [Trichonephila clavipes]